MTGEGTVAVGDCVVVGDCIASVVVTRTSAVVRAAACRGDKKKIIIFQITIVS